jgi:hypothetical protein
MEFATALCDNVITSASDYVKGNLECKYCGLPMIKKVTGDKSYFTHEKTVECDDWMHFESDPTMHLKWKEICKTDATEFIIKKKKFRHCVDIYNNHKNIVINIVGSLATYENIIDRGKFFYNCYIEFTIYKLNMIWIIDVKTSGAIVLFSAGEKYLMILLKQEFATVENASIYYDTEYGLVRILVNIKNFCLCEIIDLKKFIATYFTGILINTTDDAYNILSANNKKLDIPMYGLEIKEHGDDNIIVLTNINDSKIITLSKYLAAAGFIFDESSQTLSCCVPSRDKLIEIKNDMRESIRLINKQKAFMPDKTGIVYVLFNEIDKYFYVGSTALMIDVRKKLHLSAANDKAFDTKLYNKIIEISNVHGFDVWHMFELASYNNISTNDLRLREDTFVRAALSNPKCLNTNHVVASNTIIETINFEEKIKEYMNGINKNRLIAQIKIADEKLNFLKQAKLKNDILLNLLNDSVKCSEDLTIKGTYTAAKEFRNEHIRRMNYASQQINIYYMVFGSGYNNFDYTSIN